MKTPGIGSGVLISVDGKVMTAAHIVQAADRLFTREKKPTEVEVTGDDRFVVDYVRSEVLVRLSKDRQRFLTRTSILDRLNGSVCDAVMEHALGEAIPRASAPTKTISGSSATPSRSSTAA